MEIDNARLDTLRESGQNRIELLLEEKSNGNDAGEWNRKAHSFPFQWGECWKQCIEYRVHDFAAELGFFVDCLGFELNAFDEDYAMFTGPGRDFFFSIVPGGEDGSTTPPDSIKLEFMIDNIHATVAELEGRGVEFSQQARPCMEGSGMLTATFHSPHGISINLWGFAGD